MARSTKILRNLRGKEEAFKMKRMIGAAGLFG
jgi:hypothetical protein